MPRAIIEFRGIVRFPDGTTKEKSFFEKENIFSPDGSLVGTLIAWAYSMLNVRAKMEGAEAVRVSSNISMTVLEEDLPDFKQYYEDKEKKVRSLEECGNG